MKLSLIVHTKNSAGTLAKTLKSARHLVDEIIIVDMGSQDETLKIAKKFKSKVYQHQDVGYADPARNYGLSLIENGMKMISMVIGCLEKILFSISGLNQLAGGQIIN